MAKMTGDPPRTCTDAAPTSCYMPQRIGGEICHAFGLLVLLLFLCGSASAQNSGGATCEKPKDTPLSGTWFRASGANGLAKLIRFDETGEFVDHGEGFSSRTWMTTGQGRLRLANSTFGIISDDIVMLGGVLPISCTYALSPARRCPKVAPADVLKDVLDISGVDCRALTGKYKRMVSASVSPLVGSWVDESGVDVIEFSHGGDHMRHGVREWIFLEGDSNDANAWKVDDKVMGEPKCLERVVDIYGRDYKVTKDKVVMLAYPSISIPIAHRRFDSLGLVALPGKWAVSSVGNDGEVSVVGGGFGRTTVASCHYQITKDGQRKRMELSGCSYLGPGEAVLRPGKMVLMSGKGVWPSMNRCPP